MLYTTKMLALFCTAAVVTTEAACPYSKLWMTHGPEKAAAMLEEAAPDVRRANAGRRTMSPLAATLSTGYGTCSWANPFSGGADCAQLMDEGWDEAESKKMCDNAMMGMATGTLVKGGRCPQLDDPNVAGYCVTGEAPLQQASIMTMQPGNPMMGSCEQVSSACSMWSQGLWMPAGKCAGDESPDGDSTSGAPAQKGPQPCAIAPGPMGAAHMLSSSSYAADCKDAPAAGSPYQWPLRWTALQHTVSLPTTPEHKPHSSTTRVYYDATRNWKRSDTLAQEGTFALDFNDWDPKTVDQSIMLHRGNDMRFLTFFKNGTKTCRKMDMGVIGNIRPDWFLDTRGAQTSAQYMGNQYVFLEGKPTLVKQWRKMDFANMYFIMSMAAKPDPETGVHWPLMRNDPGEGFGPDNLHRYTEHELLEEGNDDPFMIDDGMYCPDYNRGGGGMMGGDSKEEGEGGGSGGGFAFGGEEVPSFLNVDEAGWVELTWSGSPNGEKTPPLMMGGIPAHSPPGKAQGEKAISAPPSSLPAGVDLDLDGKGTLRICSEGAGRFQVEASFSSPGWVSMGHPTTETARCSMLPADVVLAENKDGWTVGHSPLHPGVRGLAGQAMTDFRADLARGKESKFAFADAAVAEFEGSVVLSYTFSDKSEDKLHFTWASGNNGPMSYHEGRGCTDVEVNDVPACGGATAVSDRPSKASKRSKGKKGDAGFNAGSPPKGKKQRGQGAKRGGKRGM